MLFLSNILFTYWRTSTIGLGISTALIALLSYLATVVVNCCLMIAADKPDLLLWLSVSHGMYGVGGLTSPLLVNWFQLNTYFALGILCAVLSPFFLILASPEDVKKEEQEQAVEQQVV